MEGMAVKIKFILAMIAVTLVCSGAAYAEGKYRMIEVFLQKVGVSVNGQTLGREADSMIYNGSVYVPLRQLSELLGAEVSWDGSNKTVNLDFIVDQSPLLLSVSEQGVYQYIAVQNNMITKGLVESLKQNDMQAMKKEIERFEELKQLAEEMDNLQLADAFAKLMASAEIMRSGYAAKEMEDFYLGWEIFNSTSRSVNQTLDRELQSD
jgi:hypothetical protein